MSKYKLSWLNERYKQKVRELRDDPRLFTSSDTYYAKLFNKVRLTSPKQKRVEQLQGAGYGWQAIYEKLISEGYYK